MKNNEQKLQHCQNCNQYKIETDLKSYGALMSVCGKCRRQLEGAAMEKRQQSFFDDQEMLF